MIIKKMSEINEFNEISFNKNTLKLIEKDYGVLAREINAMAETMDAGQTKALIKYAKLNQGLEIDVVKLVLNGFDYNLARHMTAISRNMESYCALGEMLIGTTGWCRFLVDLRSRVNFFIKDLIHQSYTYARQDKASRASANEAKVLLLEVESAFGPIEAKYSFFNDVQDRAFFSLLNQLLYVKGSLDSNNPDKVIYMLRDFNIKKLISVLEVPFEEFQTKR